MAIDRQSRRLRAKQSIPARTARTSDGVQGATMTSRLSIAAGPCDRLSRGR